MKQEQMRCGRGVAGNPPHRFAATRNAPLADDDVWWAVDDDAPPATMLRWETPRSAIAYNASPDLPFDRALNPYRGCEHGCAYCFARPTHEYLDLSAGLDFETILIAKRGLGAVLGAELARPSYEPAPIALGAATDVYQPIERSLNLTRSLIAVLADARHPFMITTKSSAVRRDLDLIAPEAEAGRAGVLMSICTLDRSLARRLEPRATTPARRLEAVTALADAGVPVGVLASPMIPGLNDHELEAILNAARNAGAVAAGWSLLRLPGAVAGLMAAWFDAHAPARKTRALALLTEAGDGRLYDPRFGRRGRGVGPYARMLDQRFQTARRRLGLAGRAEVETEPGTPPFWALDVSAFAPRGRQGRLFA